MNGISSCVRVLSIGFRRSRTCLCIVRGVNSIAMTSGRRGAICNLIMCRHLSSLRLVSIRGACAVSGDSRRSGPGRARGMPSSYHCCVQYMCTGSGSTRKVNSKRDGFRSFELLDLSLASGLGGGSSTGPCCRCCSSVM